MPYTNQEIRDEFAPYVERLANFIAIRGLDSAELNYLVTLLMINSLAGVAEGVDRMSYRRLSGTHAAVADAAGEFKRRLIDPYEDAVASKNGDLYAPLASKVPPLRPKEEEKP